VDTQKLHKLGLEIVTQALCGHPSCASFEFCFFFVPRQLPRGDSQRSGPQRIGALSR
jgi:hypothetical protein